MSALCSFVAAGYPDLIAFGNQRARRKQGLLQQRRIAVALAAVRAVIAVDRFHTMKASVFHLSKPPTWNPQNMRPFLLLIVTVVCRFVNLK